MARASERKSGRDTRENVRNYEGRDTRVWRERDHDWMIPREEGWIPVIGNHRTRREEEVKFNQVYTLFVDNIPEMRDHLWLARLFNKYEVVSDAFIPKKRSNSTGSKFGFVRFTSRRAVELAIDKLNGIWVDDKRLHVKEASFYQTPKRGDKERFPRGKVGVRKGQSQGFFEQGGERRIIAGGQREQARSYAEVVQGDLRVVKQGNERNRTMKINPVGIGWLNRSLVAKLRRIVPLSYLKASCCKSINRDIIFRSMGGRAILITLSSPEERNEVINHPWMEQWLDEVKPWQGEAASNERFVWLGCYCFPLAGWNMRTFREVGERWGTFIEVGEETLRETSFAKGRILIATNEAAKIEEEVIMEIKGRGYRVRVIEESSVITPDEVCVRNTEAGDASFNGGLRIQGEPGKERLEEGDDDVDCDRVNESNGKEAIGGKICQVRSLVTGNLRKKGVKDISQGSKQKGPGIHLMPALSSVGYESTADLDSCVAESMEKKEAGPNEEIGVSNLNEGQRLLGLCQDQTQEDSGANGRPECGKGHLSLDLE